MKRFEIIYIPSSGINLKDWDLGHCIEYINM